jgi:anti-anti-sigma factor
MDVVANRSARVLVDIRWHGDQATVAVHGEIDFFTAPALSARLGEVIEVARPRRLILDLAGVRFLDCAGARAVADARAALPECCQVVIRSLRPSPRRVFEITGLWHGCVVDGILRTEALE